MKIQGSKYDLVSTASANISDSFVVPANKSGSASGEARLYVSSKKSKKSGSFFTFNSTIDIDGYVGAQGHCFFSKENLIKYMEDIKVFYDFPVSTYRQDVSLLYQDRMEVVCRLEEINWFQVYNQSSDLDADRFYIGSKNSLWELMRTICLPKSPKTLQPLTVVHIHKLVNRSNKNDVIYYFELFVNQKSKSRKKKSKQLLTKKILKKIKNDTSISNTERKSLVVSRLGQGKFRRNTLDIMSSCPFTSIDDQSLLIASHIMPWAHCTNNNQRLDGFNGVALTPTFDLLFDRGLISFENNGRLKISPYLSNNIIGRLNLQAGNPYEIGNSAGNKNTYLEYHRKYIFLFK